VEADAKRLHGVHKPSKLHSTNAITVPHVQIMVGASISEVKGKQENVPMTEVYHP
jgi:hypothetical protein